MEPDVELFKEVFRAVRDDRVLRSPLAWATVAGYAALVFLALPDWLVLLLHTLVWVQVVTYVLAAVGMTTLMFGTRDIYQKMNVQQRTKIEELVHQYRPVTILMQVFMIASLYKIGYTGAGVTMLLAIILVHVSIRTCRATLDNMGWNG